MVRITPMVKEAIYLLEFPKRKVIEFMEREAARNPFLEIKGQVELFDSGSHGFDIQVRKNRGKFQVSLDKEDLPEILINDNNNGSSNQFKQALWILKSVKRREKILLRVSRAVFNFQKDFFNGKKLAPLSMTVLAKITGLSVSAVSRITREKKVSTPKGEFFLKDFLKKDDSMKIKVKELKEKNKNMSDREIGEILNIPRRTVAKYRRDM